MVEKSFLQLKTVTKRLGDVVAVNNVSFDVAKGEFVTLLGPSGSGKTTTLRMISGFLTPDEGNIFLEGRDLIDVPPNKRDIGMVYQHYALFPHKKVYDNIAFPLRMRKYNKDEITKKVKHMLELVNLPGYEGRYPRQLSGGEQQRVAIARALIYDPSLLLVDEPLGPLDAKLRKSMQHEILKIQKGLGVTTVYVTHNQEKALTMSDRIVVYNHGSVIQIGSGRELYEKPQNEFIATFLGEINLPEGQVKFSNQNETKIQADKGFVIVASSIRDRSAGEKVKVVIRPSNIRVFKNEPPVGLQNSFRGKIAKAIFLGDRIYYRVIIDGKELDVLTGAESSSGTFSEGSIVSLGWDVADCRVL
jgi:ABC-type Fe3+/spermidine/putrescine transport system ATPase subunit